MILLPQVYGGAVLQRHKSHLPAGLCWFHLRLIYGLQVRLLLLLVRARRPQKLQNVCKRRFETNVFFLKLLSLSLKEDPAEPPSSVVLPGRTVQRSRYWKQHACTPSLCVITLSPSHAPTT